MKFIFSLFFYCFLLSNTCFGNNKHCCDVRVKSDKKKNLIELEFDLYKNCKFYTFNDNGSKNPAISISNKNILIKEINWPSGSLKKERFGDTDSYNSLVSDNFTIKIFVKKEEKIINNDEFIVTLDYFVSKNGKTIKEKESVKFDKNWRILLSKTVIQDPISTYKKSIIDIFIRLFLAFLAGVILNFMPCVLPVLGIKLASLSYMNKSKNDIRVAALISLFGIIFAFILLGIFSSFIKIPLIEYSDVKILGGILQNRYFVVVSIILLSIFIDISRGKYSIFINDHIFSGKLYYFFGGVLSTILGASCIAPIVGMFFIFSVDANFIENVAIFLFIGFGFGFFYLLTIFFPDFYKKLPRVGLFSIILKKILNTLLFLTFFWLLYIVYRKSGIYMSFFIMCSVFAFSNFVHKIKKRSLRVLFFFLLFIPIVFITGLTNNNIKNDTNGIWHEYTSAELDNGIYSDNIVVVFGKADWCSWCHIVKFFVLERNSFVNFVQNNNIVLLELDLSDETNREALDFYKLQPSISGVPFIQIYSSTNPVGRTLPIKSLFSIKSIINEIEIENESLHMIKKS